MICAGVADQRLWLSSYKCMWLWWAKRNITDGNYIMLVIPAKACSAFVDFTRFHDYISSSQEDP